MATCRRYSWTGHAHAHWWYEHPTQRVFSLASLRTVPSECRSASLDSVAYFGWRHTFNDWKRVQERNETKTRHFLRWLRMPMQVVNEQRRQERAARQLRRERCDRGLRSLKPPVTKINAHLRVQSRWSAEMWKKVTLSHESSFTIFPTKGQAHVWYSERSETPQWERSWGSGGIC